MFSLHSRFCCSLISSNWTATKLFICSASAVTFKLNLTVYDDLLIVKCQKFEQKIKHIIWTPQAVKIKQVCHMRYRKISLLFSGLGKTHLVWVREKVDNSHSLWLTKQGQQHPLCISSSYHYFWDRSSFNQEHFNIFFPFLKR